MPDDVYSLALETSSAIDSIALGRGDQLLETVALPQRKAGRSSELMPAIADLFTRCDILPAQLGEVYVSVGPGSFTGLRIGITVAQMLASVLGVKAVAVPTIDVVAQNAAPPTSTGTSLLVCLNQKRESVYTGTFTHDATSWVPAKPPSVMPLATALAGALAGAPGPVQLLSQTVLNFGDMPMDGVDVLATTLATPSAAVVWQLGRNAAAQHAYTAAPRLLPIYARVPEAVELWDKRHG